MADLRHLATLMLCVAACSPPVHADPITQPRRPRIELRTVKHSWGTIIGAYVRDNELGEPVAPARAEDGKMRWLPIEDWAPSATPAPRSVHSAELGLWLDPACSLGKCVPLTSAERDQKLAGRGAWEVTERYLPERFVEVQYTETAAEQSVRRPSRPSQARRWLRVCRARWATTCPATATRHAATGRTAQAKGAACNEKAKPISKRALCCICRHSRP